MSKIDVSELSSEEKKKLLEQLEKDEKVTQEQRKKNIQSYNDLKHETVLKVFAKLEKISQDMTETKTNLLDEFKALLDSKNELFDVNETQLSHNWTTKEGDITIITGFNTVDRWDESVSAGVTKVQEWMDKQSGENNMILGFLRDLLKPNKEGVLNARRVLDMQNRAEEHGDQELIDAVALIRLAHRPYKTGTYIKAKYKDEDGNTHWLGLSMSTV